MLKRFGQGIAVFMAALMIFYSVPIYGHSQHIAGGINFHMRTETVSTTGQLENALRDPQVTTVILANDIIRFDGDDFGRTITRYAIGNTTIQGNFRVSGYNIRVRGSDRLVLDGPTLAGRISIADSATFVMRSGRIDAATPGGTFTGVSVFDNATFIMDGGVIDGGRRGVGVSSMWREHIGVTPFTGTIDIRGGAVTGNGIGVCLAELADFAGGTLNFGNVHIHGNSTDIHDPLGVLTATQTPPATPAPLSPTPTPLPDVPIQQPTLPSTPTPPPATGQPPITAGNRVFYVANNNFRVTIAPAPLEFRDVVPSSYLFNDDSDAGIMPPIRYATIAQHTIITVEVVGNQFSLDLSVGYIDAWAASYFLMHDSAPRRATHAFNNIGEFEMTFQGWQHFWTAIIFTVVEGDASLQPPVLPEEGPQASPSPEGEEQNLPGYGGGQLTPPPIGPDAERESGELLRPVEPIPEDVDPDDIIFVSNEAELRALADNDRISPSSWYSRNIYVVLTNDIFLTEEWTPFEFLGTFDGQGHAIHNLFVLEGSGHNAAGLFSVVRQGSVIKNVYVNISQQGVNSRNVAGGVVGRIHRFQHHSPTVTMTNVSVAGNISGRTAGGLVGADVDGGGLGISYSSVVGNVNATDGIGTAGGLVGSAVSGRELSILSSHFAGNVLSNRASGGLVGSARNLTVSDGYSSGNVLVLLDVGSQAYAGGLVGRLSGNNIDVSINNSRSSSTVEAFVERLRGEPLDINAGGLIGASIWTTRDGIVRIVASSASGDVTAAAPMGITNSRVGARAGGLVGNLNPGWYIIDSTASGNVRTRGNTTRDEVIGFSGALVGGFVGAEEERLQNIVNSFCTPGHIVQRQNLIGNAIDGGTNVLGCVCTTDVGGDARGSAAIFLSGATNLVNTEYTISGTFTSHTMLITPYQLTWTVCNEDAITIHHDRFATDTRNIVLDHRNIWNIHIPVTSHQVGTFTITATLDDQTYAQVAFAVRDKNFQEASAAFIVQHGHRLYRPIIDGVIYSVYQISNGVVRYGEGGFFIEQRPGWDRLYLIGRDENGRYILVTDYYTVQRAGYLQRTNEMLADGGVYSADGINEFILAMMVSPDGTDAHSQLEYAWRLYETGNFFVNMGNLVGGIPSLLKGNITAPATFLYSMFYKHVMADYLDYTKYTRHFLRSMRRTIGFELIADLHAALEIIDPVNLENGFIRNFDDAVTLRRTGYTRTVYLEYFLMDARYLRAAADAAIESAMRNIMLTGIGLRLRELGEAVDTVLKFTDIVIDGVEKVVMSLETSNDPELRRMHSNLIYAFETFRFDLYSPFLISEFGNFQLLFDDDYYFELLDADSYDEFISRLNQVLLISCPVDVVIFSEADELIGLIISDSVVFSSGMDNANPLFVMVHYATKILVFPDYRDYRIEILATDAGSMSYLSFNLCDNVGVVTGTGIYNILLREGGTFTVNPSESGYNPGFDRLFSDREPISIIVNATAAEGGEVYVNSAGHIAGEMVHLLALPQDNYRFYGWFENDMRLYYAEAIFTFVATKDRSLEARFIPSDRVGWFAANGTVVASLTAGVVGLILVGFGIVLFQSHKRKRVSMIGLK